MTLKVEGNMFRILNLPNYISVYQKLDDYQNSAYKLV